MQSSNYTLYLLVLALITAVVISALGGGLFDQHQFWRLQWQHQAFFQLCHQIPERSFWINGQPTAVCSRCLGIYSGFALGWMLLPAIDFLKIFRFLPVKMILIAAVLINLFDTVGNFIGFWENTLTSRLILGCIMGLAAAVLFSGTFFNKKTKSTGKHYGRITTSGI